MICGFAWLAGRWTGDVDMAMVRACIYMCTYVNVRASSIRGRESEFCWWSKSTVPGFDKATRGATQEPTILSKCFYAVQGSIYPPHIRDPQRRCTLRKEQIFALAWKGRKQFTHLPTLWLRLFFWVGSPFWFLAH
jgi:hypothetical protein